MFLQDFSAKIRFLHILARFYTLKTAENWNQSLWIVYGSIILKKNLVAQDTHTHQWFDRQNYRRKKSFLGHPNQHCVWHHHVRTAGFCQHEGCAGLGRPRPGCLLAPKPRSLAQLQVNLHKSADKVCCCKHPGARDSCCFPEGPVQTIQFPEGSVEIRWFMKALLRY